MITLAIMLTLSGGDTYVTKHGLIVSSESKTIDRVQVEEATSLVIDYFAGDRDALRGLSLLLVRDRFDQHCNGRRVSGCYLPKSGLILVLLKSDCVAKTSLAHELTHAAEHKIDGIVDYGHDGFHWSAKNGPVWGTNKVLYQLYCE